MNRAHLLAILMGITLLLPAFGCSTFNEYWKDSQKFYYDNIHPTPEIDYEDEAPGDDEELLLARAMEPVDSELEAVVRMLVTLDEYPDQAWFDRFLERFPWVNGVAVLDVTGKVLDREPESSLKPINGEAVVALSEDWADRGMRALVENTPLGPELYIAYPFYVDNDWKGLNVVQLDPRNLVKRSPMADDLMLFAPGLMIWSGRFGDDALDVSAELWNERLAEDVSGEIETGSGTFFWLARNVGRTHIVYATPKP